MQPEVSKGYYRKQTPPAGNANVAQAGHGKRNKDKAAKQEIGGIIWLLGKAAGYNKPNDKVERAGDAFLTHCGVNKVAPPESLK